MRDEQKITRARAWPAHQSAPSARSWESVFVVCPTKRTAAQHNRFTHVSGCHTSLGCVRVLVGGRVLR